MLELFLPWFLMTCISGVLGNRADAKFVSITQKISEQVKVGKIINQDMQKALNRSFLSSLINICNSSLGELNHESYLQKGNFKLSSQIRWLETKKISLEDELKAVEKAEYMEPTDELLDETKILLTQGDPASEAFQNIKTELIERAEVGNDKAPECYKKSVEENILSQMYNHFAYEIKSNQAISNILETQLLIQLDIKIDALLASVPSMVQNLSIIPLMDQKIDYVYNVAQSMPQMLESIRSEKSSDATYRIPFQVPPLTEDFVETPKKEEIKTYLLNNNSRGILAITAIQGLGGIGKTTVATLLCHDRDIQNNFSEGILWTTLGQEPDNLSLLNSWIQELGDYQSNHTRVETASNHLRTLLYEKNILLIVDDAWNFGDVRPFLVGGPKCQTIITTRKSYIADDIGAKSHLLNLMTEEQSLELYRNVLEDCWDENEKDNALKVAKDVGYLPLALNLAAKRRKKGYSWVKLHKALEEEIARLDILESPRIFGKGEEGLEASLNLSLKALRLYNEKAWKNFIWLGVLPEDVKINEKMASTLWNIDTEKARETLEGLWGEGLLIQSSTIHFVSEKLETYQMHDLFHDIARRYLTLSSVTIKPTDIPGLGLKLSEAHTSLLNCYQSQTQKKGLWHTLIDDAYIHSHLIWHMEKAEHIENIHKLLIEETENGKNGWYEALESLGQNTDFIEDVMRAWSLAGKESKHKIEHGSKASSIGFEILYALIYTSINSLSANIPVKLLVELLETKKWTETKVLAYAQKEPNLYKRVLKLVSIIPKVNSDLVKKEAIERAIDSTYKIQTEEQKIEALSLIINYVDEDKKEEIQEEIQVCISKILDKELNERLFPFIIPYLDTNRKDYLIKKALDSVSTMPEVSQKLHPLIYVIPYLEGSERKKVEEEAVSYALMILDGFRLGDRSYLPFYLIPHLKDDDKKEIIIKRSREVISDSPYSEYEIVNMLSLILPFINDPNEKSEVVEEALHYVLGTDHKFERVVALSSIIPYIEESTRRNQLIEEALIYALKIQDECEMISVQSSVIPYLEDNTEKYKLVTKILDNASKIQDTLQKVRILSSILPYIEGSTKDKVIENSLGCTLNLGKHQMIEALSLMIPHVKGSKKEEIMEKILYCASNTYVNNIHIRELSSVFPHFEGTQKNKLEKKLLNYILKMEVEDQVNIITPIIPFLEEKEEIIGKIFEDFPQIKSEHLKVKFLSSVFPNVQKEKILEHALKIEDEYDKAKLISSTIPYFEEKKEIEKKKEIIQKTLDCASKIKNEYQRAVVIHSALPYIEETSEKEKMTKDILDDALKIKDNYYLKVKIIFYMFEHIEKHTRSTLIEEVSDDILKIEGAYAIIDVLPFILPYIDKEKKEKVIEKAFKKALITPNNKDLMIKVMNLMTDNLEESASLRILYSGWKDLIGVISEYTRRDFLRYLQVTMPAIYKLGGEKALIEITFAIDDSSRWWP